MPIDVEIVMPSVVSIVPSVSRVVSTVLENALKEICLSNLGIMAEAGTIPNTSRPHGKSHLCYDTQARLQSTPRFRGDETFRSKFDV